MHSLGQKKEKNDMKKMLDFFKYFFCTSNRFVASTIILILIVWEIFSCGFVDFLSFAFEIFIAVIGAFILTVIDGIIYIILKSVWYADTEDEPFRIDDIFKKEFLIGMLFANICAILYLVYKGTIVWQ